MLIIAMLENKCEKEEYMGEKCDNEAKYAI